MALVMCVVMLVGTTFAWFTDTASTAVNKIQAGNLKVDIVDKEDNSLDGKTLSFTNKQGSSDILWEPGATFNLDSFKIVNKGNLAFKYKVVISGVDGNAKLLKAIDFSVKIGDAEKVTLADWDGILLPEGKTATTDNEAVGATDLITISGTMKKEAGNEYQGLSIDGIGITVVATQYTYEYDSQDNQYDLEAKYDPEPITAAELRKIFVDEAGELKSDVKLDKNYLLTDEWTPITASGAPQPATIDGQGHTIYNMTVNGGSKLGFIGDNSADLTIKNLTFSNATVVGTGSFLGVVIGYQYGDVKLENVQVVNSLVKSTAEKGIRIGGLVGYSALHDSAKLTLKDCTVKNSNFEGYHNTCGLVGTLYGYTDHTGSWSVDNCTVSGCHFVWGSPVVKYNHYAFVDGGQFLLTEPDAAISGVTMTNNTCERR
jgi:predicted ribosomally synthesized peptide with SipW-like signal peptide